MVAPDVEEAMDMLNYEFLKSFGILIPGTEDELTLKKVKRFLKWYEIDMSEIGKSVGGSNAPTDNRQWTKII